MHISQFKDSKFLRKEDVGKGILVTIDRIEQQNVAMQGEAEELRFVLVFREDVKPMVVNMTNAKLIAMVTGSEDTDDWHGHQIVCYTDPTIAYAGKIIGGIRVRAPKNQPHAVPNAAPAPIAPPVQRPAPVPAPAPEEEDDVPF
jgi:hypothetical protein